MASSYFSVDFLSKSNSRAGNTSSANPQSKQTEMGRQTDTGGTRRSLISGKLVVNSPSTCCMFSDLHALQAILRLYLHWKDGQHFEEVTAPVVILARLGCG